MPVDVFFLVGEGIVLSSYLVLLHSCWRNSKVCQESKCCFLKLCASIFYLCIVILGAKFTILRWKGRNETQSNVFCIFLRNDISYFRSSPKMGREIGETWYSVDKEHIDPVGRYKVVNDVKGYIIFKSNIRLSVSMRKSLNSTHFEAIGIHHFKSWNSIIDPNYLKMWPNMHTKLSRVLDRYQLDFEQCNFVKILFRQSTSHSEMLW